MRRAERLVDSFLKSKIDAARVRDKAGGGEESLLDTILKKELEEGGSTLSDGDLRDELLTFLLAVCPDSLPLL